MSRSDLPKVGTKIIVHRPDAISTRRRAVKKGDVAKVLGYLGDDRVLAFNPEWINEVKPEYAKGWTHNGPCVVLWLGELRRE